MDNDDASDYINANFVDGYMQKNAYICSQGKQCHGFKDFFFLIVCACVLFALIPFGIVLSSYG